MAKQAIEGVRKNAFARDPKTMLIVGIDEVPGVMDPKNHPLYEDPARLVIDDAMVRNIMHYGVIEPVVVCRDGENVVVVDGRRRVLHARRANELLFERGGQPILVTCVVRDGDDGDLMGVMVTANSIRLEESTLQKAKKASRMLNNGMSDEAVATAFGVGVPAIRQWQSVLTCAKPVLDALDAGTIPVGVAVELSRVPKGEQGAKLEEMLSAGGGKVTVKEARAAKTRTEDGEAKTSSVPGKRELRAVIEHLSGADDESAALIVATLQWVIGERVPPRLVSAALRAAEGAKKK